MSQIKTVHVPPVFRPSGRSAPEQARPSVAVPPVYRPGVRIAVQAKTAVLRPPPALPVAMPPKVPMAPRSFAAPVNAVVQRRAVVTGGVIKQRENKGTFWRDAGEARPSMLAHTIELYKKEVLTFIAEVARKGVLRAYPQLRDVVPHVAVVIQGATCHVAINNIDFSDSFPDVMKWRVKHLLHLRSQQALALLRARFETMHWRHGANPQRAQALRDTFKRNEEALYVALRWAAKVTTVRVQPVLDKIEGGVVHGEMAILNNEFADADAPGNESAAMRVLRVGGTKTPCFDCAYAMGVHADGMDGVTDLRYRAVASQAGARKAWTMTRQFGAGFRNWTDPRDYTVYRGMSVNPTRMEGFCAQQNQDADYLKRQLDRVRRYNPLHAKRGFLDSLKRLKLGLPSRALDR